MRGLLGDLLGTKPFVHDALATARAAFHHRWGLVTAVVAFELLWSFVVGQRYVTTGTPFHMPTRLALLKAAEPPSILKQDDAFFLSERSAHGIDELDGKIAFHFLALSSTDHIHDFKFWQWGGVKPFEQLNQVVSALLGIEHAV